jgi:hypothetical protein
MCDAKEIASCTGGVRLKVVSSGGVSPSVVSPVLSGGETAAVLLVASRILHKYP